MMLNYHIGCIVLGLLCVGVRMRFGEGGIRAAGFSTQQSKNNTANVAVQHHSRKLLKMDILMSETC